MWQKEMTPKCPRKLPRGYMLEGREPEVAKVKESKSPFQRYSLWWGPVQPEGLKLTSGSSALRPLQPWLGHPA